MAVIFADGTILANFTENKQTMCAENMKKFPFLTITLAFFGLLVLVQCKKDTQLSGKVTDSATPTYDSASTVIKDSAVQEEAPRPQITYASFIFPAKKKDSAMAAFNKQFSEEERYIILALNRLDSKINGGPIPFQFPTSSIKV